MMKLILGVVAIGALIGLASFIPSLNKGDQGIVVFVESGSVSMKESKDSTYKPLLEKKVSVTSGTYIKTEKGLAHIVFPNNSVASLGEFAELELQYADAGISILQLMGDTYHRVQKLASGKSYEVRTPGTLAAVRGTKFAVSYNVNAKKAKIAVTENDVAVSRPNATTTASVSVKVGSLAGVDENLPLTAKNAVSVSLTKNDTSIKNWLDRNTLLDQYIGDNPREFLDSFITTSGDSNNLKNLRDRLEKAKTYLIKPTTENKIGESKKGTIKTLLALGTAQKCSYTMTEGDTTSNATIYLSKESMRIDGTTVVRGKNETFHMILANKTMYAWGDGMPQGIRMPVPDANGTATTEGSAQFVDLDKEMNYSCSSWVSDASYFTPPRTVTFMDMSQMINQVAPVSGTTGGTVDVKALQCGACDSLGEPDKTQCKQALGCR